MDLKEVCNEDIKNDTIILRRAVQEDIDALVNISRTSFPERLVWHISRLYARKLWEAILSWGSTETWVCIIGDCIICRNC